MANSYFTKIHSRKIITENVIFNELHMSKYVQYLKSKSRKHSFLVKLYNFPSKLAYLFTNSEIFNNIELSHK